MLNPEQLQVESFATASSATYKVPGGASESPDCIVYVSDCVSCFPDPAGGVQ